MSYPRTIEEVLASAPRGFPRPMTGTLPTPWIARVGDLGDVDVFRRAACIEMRLCQVCGLELGITTTVFWRHGDVVVIDGAALHPKRCAPMAERFCPELVKLAEAGRLHKATILTEALEAIDLSGFARDQGMPRGYAIP